jgi:glucose uptake protein GlcU
MFDIAMSVAFYSAVGLLYKFGGKHGRNLLATNLAVFAAWCRPVVVWRDAVIGGGIGAFSVLGAFFLLRALAHQPATLVFPASSAGNLVLVALLSVPLFREALRWKGWSGVALGATALALMG